MSAATSRLYAIKQRVNTAFDGYELPTTLAKELAELVKDETLRTEIKAMKRWNLVVKAMSTGNAPASRISVMCNRMVTQYHGTETARVATRVTNGPAQ